MTKTKWAVLGLLGLATYSLGAAADLLSLSTASSWTKFQQYRAVAHLEVLTKISALAPPIGILGAVHHSGRLMDAVIDKNQPSDFTMSYLRGIVTKSDDCAQKISAFERSLSKGQSSKTGSIVCQVPFGMGIQDSFKMQVMSNRVGDTVKTSFFVNGLGIVPCTESQSPLYLLRHAGSLEGVLAAPFVAGDSLLAKLMHYDLAQPVWMNLTESSQTSVFTDGGHRMTVNSWQQKTRQLHQSGGGYSAAEVF